MKGRISSRTGCVLALLVPVCIVLLFVGSFGLARTSAPYAADAATDVFTLHVESAADPQDGRGAWPVTYSTAYSDEARIRGTLTPRSPTLPIAKLALVIISPTGARRDVRCLPEYREACYFYANLRPATLTQGVVVTVIDLRTGKPLAPASRFSFARSTGYSSVYWDGLMGI